MTKRRAEEPLLLLHDLPSKTLPRSLLSVDLQLEPDPPAARPVSRSPPAPPAVLGRKRPHSSEQKPEDPGVTTRKRDADGVTVQTSGSVQEHRSCGSPANHKKRPREECDASPPGAPDKVADTDTNTEDSAYNSFQFWRPPLPELDLSLLEDYDSHSKTEHRSNVKGRSSDAMET